MDGDGAGGATVAVLDVGKSNVKLSACTADGHVVETLSTPNRVLPGPPWVHHDLASLNPWVMAGLAALATRHPLTDFVASGHGSGGCWSGQTLMRAAPGWCCRWWTMNSRCRRG